MIRRLRRIITGSLRRVVALTLLAAALVVSRAGAGPVLGFVEDWPGTSLENWGGGSDITNLGTGGVGGDGDGYLLISTPFPTHLGARSMGPEYAGDWVAAGITRVRLWLSDVGSDDPLEIHFSFGNAITLWQCNTGFGPPLGTWQEYVVDLTDPSNFTRIVGQASFDATLRNVDRIHVRHDRAPYGQSPDPLQGDFGLDRVMLTSASEVPVAPVSWGRLKTLYR